MTQLILALDTEDATAAFAVLDQVGSVKWVKVGSTLFVREGPEFVRTLVHRGYSVFLDLKWHDIPNTVSGAVRQARVMGVRMATVHTLGGVEIMAAAAKAAGEDVRIVGVTVLTSHTAASFGAATGRDVRDPAAEAIRLSRNALEAGLAGVVCSAREARAVRSELGPDGLIVVPGIRRPGDPSGDQNRTATPGEAVAAGATHLVVGRPVLTALDPALAWTDFTHGL